MFIIRREIRDLIVDKLHLICLQALQIIGLLNQACQRESSKAYHILSCIFQFDKKLLYVLSSSYVGKTPFEDHILRNTYLGYQSNPFQLLKENVQRSPFKVTL